jgi:hypothetical protein
MKLLSRLAGLALLVGLLGATAAEARTRIYVRVGPPPVVVERAVVTPGPGYVWVAGHHQWTGREYTWVPGSWVRAPYRHARWVSGNWQRSHRGYYWRDGYWRRR